MGADRGAGAVSHMCPHCGYNLVAEAPMRAGDFEYSNDGLTFRDQPVKLRLQERVLVGTLMHAQGRVVSRDVLLDRLGTDAMPGIISVLISKTRRALRAIEAPDPIRTVHGQGLRWAGPAPVRYQRPG